uniref:Apple domain-containing protein n=1 Tax=Panagrolaimus sp. PS1159 TaxID=55785 RepID=A0AC35EUU7_9BILA
MPKYYCLTNLLIYIFILLFCIQNITAANNFLCNWQKARTGINAEEINPQNRKSLGYAINSDHCGSLCMMNQAMFASKPCGAYAFTYDTPFTGPKHNCFMYTPEIDSSSFKLTGTFDFYKQTCNNSTTTNPATSNSTKF